MRKNQGEEIITFLRDGAAATSGSFSGGLI
jgi:hypothetical protein